MKFRSSTMEALQTGNLPSPVGGRTACVEKTNDMCTTSKLSCSAAGFFDDLVLPKLAAFKRRSPLINRGYAARIHAVDNAVRTFIELLKLQTRSVEETHSGKSANEPVQRVQVISLGAGFDTAYFRYVSDSGEDRISTDNDLSWTEIDLPDVSRRKEQMLLNIQDTAELKTQNCYKLVAADLTDIDNLSRLDCFAHHQHETPTLVLAEVSTVYLPYKNWTQLQQFLSARFRKCVLLDYSQICHESSAFAKFMTKHFEQLGSRILTAENWTRADAVQQAFLSCGWHWANCLNMSVYSQLYFTTTCETNKNVSGRILREPFDEFEEYYSTCFHYNITAAFTKSVATSLDRISKSQHVYEVSLPQILMLPETCRTTWVNIPVVADRWITSQPCPSGMQRMSPAACLVRQVAFDIDSELPRIAVFGGVMRYSAAYAACRNTISSQAATRSVHKRASLLQVWLVSSLFPSSPLDSSTKLGDPDKYSIPEFCCELGIARDSEHTALVRSQIIMNIPFDDSHSFSVAVFGGRTSPTDIRSSVYAGRAYPSPTPLRSTDSVSYVDVVESPFFINKIHSNEAITSRPQLWRHSLGRISATYTLIVAACSPNLKATPGEAFNNISTGVPLMTPLDNYYDCTQLFLYENRFMAKEGSRGELTTDASILQAAVVHDFPVVSASIATPYDSAMEYFFASTSADSTLFAMSGGMALAGERALDDVFIGIVSVNRDIISVVKAHFGQHHQPVTARFGHTSHFYATDDVLRGRTSVCALVLVGGIGTTAMRVPDVTVIEFYDHLLRVDVTDVPNLTYFTKCKRVVVFNLPNGIRQETMLFNHCSLLITVNDDGSAEEDRAGVYGSRTSSRIIIFGGGGNCFSFGTHFNEMLISLDIGNLILES